MSVTPSWARHVSVGGVLTQEEYEQSSGHEFDYALVRPAEFVVSPYNASGRGSAQADHFCGSATHNQTSINSIIGSIPSYGGRILLSAGYFYLGSPIMFGTAVDDYITLEGQGNSTFVSVSGSSNCDAIQGTAGTVNYLMLKNMRLLGNSTYNTSGNCINGLFRRSLFENLLIYDFAENGIKIGNGTTTGIGHTYISKCYILENKGYGIEMPYGASENWVDKCVLYGNYKSGIVIDDSFTRIVQNQIHHNHEHGLLIGTAHTMYSMLIEGNLFLNNYYDGIRIDNYSVYWTSFANNKFAANNHSAGTYSNFYIHVELPYQFSRNTVIGNIFNGESTSIYNLSITADTNYFANNAITGNSFYGGSTSEIYLANQGLRNNISNNGGILSPGEVVSSYGSLTAGSANTFAFAWQNPFATSITINELEIYVSAASGSGALLNAGTAANGSISSSNLIGSGNINTVGFLVSNGRYKLDANGGACDYITGQIVGADALTLAGSYYIRYQGM